MTTWLTAAEAALHLKRSPHEVRRNAFDQCGGKRCPPGRIPGYKPNGPSGEWRFDAEQLDRMVRGEDVNTIRQPILTRRAGRGGRRAS